MAKTVAKPETKKAEAKPAVEKSNEELLEIIAEKDAKIAEQEAVITELMESNATAGSIVAAVETVEVGGVKYVPVLKAFIHAGKRYTAADVLANPEIAAKLVKANSPAVRKA